MPIRRNQNTGEWEQYEGEDELSHIEDSLIDMSDVVLTPNTSGTTIITSVSLMDQFTTHMRARSWGTTTSHLREVASRDGEDVPRATDPNEKVEARDGKKYPISECIYFQGRYYHKKDKELVKDALTGELIHIRQANEIIVKAVFKDNRVKNHYGYISDKAYESCPTAYSRKAGWESPIISIDCIEGWDYKESISEGRYVDADYEEIPLNKVTQYHQYKNHFSRCEDIKLLTKLGQLSPSFAITEGLQYTFGVEIECSKGFLPNWVASQKQLNVLCARDGSINNGEGGPE